MLWLSICLFLYSFRTSANSRFLSLRSLDWPQMMCLILENSEAGCATHHISTKLLKTWPKHPSACSYKSVDCKSFLDLDMILASVETDTSIDCFLECCHHVAISRKRTRLLKFLLYYVLIQNNVAPHWIPRHWGTSKVRVNEKILLLATFSRPTNVILKCYPDRIKVEAQRSESQSEFKKDEEATRCCPMII